MSHCVVQGCFSVENLLPFPSDVKISAVWIDIVRKNLNKPLWNPTRTSAICKKHFPDGDEDDSLPNLANNDVKINRKRKETMLSESEIKPQKIIKTNQGDFEIISILEPRQSSESIEPQESEETSRSVSSVRITKKRSQTLIQTNAQLRDDNLRLMKQMSVYKQRLQSIEEANESFLRGMGTLFTDDQINYFRRRGEGDELPKNCKWNSDTVNKATKLRIELGDGTYRALLKLGLPFPPLAYMKRHVNFFVCQGPPTSSPPQDLSDQEDEVYDANDRASAEKAVERKSQFSLRNICKSNDHDHLLPDWLAKLPLKTRSKVCFGKVLKKSKPKKKVVKLIPCNPPEFVLQQQQTVKFERTGHALQFVLQENPKEEPLEATQVMVMDQDGNPLQIQETVVIGQH